MLWPAIVESFVDEIVRGANVFNSTLSLEISTFVPPASPKSCASVVFPATLSSPSTESLAIESPALWTYSAST